MGILHFLQFTVLGRYIILFDPTLINLAETVIFPTKTLFGYLIFALMVCKLYRFVFKTLNQILLAWI